MQFLFPGKNFSLVHETLSRGSLDVDKSACQPGAMCPNRPLPWILLVLLLKIDLGTRKFYGK